MEKFMNDYVSASELASCFGITEEELLEIIRFNRIVHYKMSRKLILFSKNDIYDWIEKRKITCFDKLDLLLQGTELRK